MSLSVQASLPIAVFPLAHMGKGNAEVLHQRHIRNKAAVRTAQAVLKELVEKHTRSINNLVSRARRSREGLVAAGLDPGSDVEDVPEVAKDRGEGVGKVESEVTDKAEEVEPPAASDTLSSDSSSGSETDEQAPEETVEKEDAVAAKPKRGRPPKSAAPAEAKEPSKRRVANSEGVYYPGFPKGDARRCAACEQLLAGRASASSKHLEECAWRARKVPVRK